MPKANHKPKGRFFRSVGIYPLVICGIDTANREQTKGTVLSVCEIVSN